MRLTNTVWVLLFTLLVCDSACYFPDVLQLLPHRRVYNISKTFSALLFTQTYITLLIHAAQMCYKDTPSQAVNCMFHNPVILLSVSSVHKHTNITRTRTAHILHFMYRAACCPPNKQRLGRPGLEYGTWIWIQTTGGTTVTREDRSTRINTYFLHQQFLADNPRIETGPAWWRTDEKPPEL